MATTRARTTSNAQSRSSSSGTRSRNSSSGTRSGSSPNRSNGGRASSAGSRTQAKGSTGRRSQKKSSSRARPASAGSSRRNQGDVRKTVSAVASKAKTPLVAGGAALVGLAGGVAISRNGSGKKLLGVRMPQIGGGGSTKKAMEGATKALGTAAKELGKAGYQAGQLTSEVRRVRERVSDD